MKKSHKRMDVTAGEFNALVEDLVKTLDKFNVGSGERAARRAGRIEGRHRRKRIVRHRRELPRSSNRLRLSASGKAVNRRPRLMIKEETPQNLHTH